MAYKNKTKKYPVDTTCQNVSCFLLRLISWLKEDAILSSPKKGFLPHLTRRVYRQLKHRQGAVLSVSPSSVFHIKFTISEWKCKLVFHCNSKWTWSTSVGVLDYDIKILCPTDSGHKFFKTGFENCLPIRFNLRSS